jgi:hypothetical protein
MVQKRIENERWEKERKGTKSLNQIERERELEERVKREREGE